MSTFIALRLIVLPLGMTLNPHATHFQANRPYGGSAPGEFDRATVVGYFGPEFASMAEAAIDRALATGSAKAKHGTAVVMDKAESDDLVITDTTGRPHALGKGRKERSTGGDTLPQIGQVEAPPIVESL